MKKMNWFKIALEVVKVILLALAGGEAASNLM